MLDVEVGLADSALPQALAPSASTSPTTTARNRRVLPTSSRTIRVTQQFPDQSPREAKKRIRLLEQENEVLRRARALTRLRPTSPAHNAHRPTVTPRQFGPYGALGNAQREPA